MYSCSPCAGHDTAAMQNELRSLDADNSAPSRRYDLEDSKLWRPLWCDKYMLVVEKDVGLLSAPGKTVKDSMIVRVTSEPDFKNARLVHRLVKHVLMRCLTSCVLDLTRCILVYHAVVAARPTLDPLYSCCGASSCSVSTLNRWTYG